MTPSGASRRALLKGAGEMLMGAGALAALSGCGRHTVTSDRALSGTDGPIMRTDVEILSAALALERRTVDAYVAAVPLLPRSEARGAQQFLRQELEHTGELISLIKTAGGKAPPRAESYDIGPPPRDRVHLFALLHELERQQIAGYLDWLPRLSPAPTRAAVATILACDAQHVAVLRGLQGQAALASAFVTRDE